MSLRFVLRRARLIQALLPPRRHSVQHGTTRRLATVADDLLPLPDVTKLHFEEGDCDQMGNRVTLQEYNRACDALREEVHQHGFLRDPRGVLIKRGVRDTRGDFKYVEFHAHDDGTWDAYLKKMATLAHEIVLPTLAAQENTWSLLNGVPTELPNISVASDDSLCRKDGNDVKAQVDIGIKLDLPKRFNGWRAVVEVEVNNLNLKNMNERLVQYMRSHIEAPDLNPNWRRLRLAVGLQLYSKRLDGTWVAIACVWRRGDGDVPTLERVFDFGTRNHGGSQSAAIRNLMNWLRGSVANGTVALDPAINLDNLVTPVPSPPGLPQPLPVRRRRVVVPDTQELRDHFIVPLQPWELCFDSGLPQDLVDRVPPFPINLYDVMLRHLPFGPTWNTPAED